MWSISLPAFPFVFHGGVFNFQLTFIHDFLLVIFFLSFILRLALYEVVNFSIQQRFPDGLEVLWV